MIECAVVTHVALLRAVNVGGNNKIAMNDLLRFFGDEGFVGARSLLQSGNIVFDGGARKGAQLEDHLEARTAARFGLRADYLVRTAAEMKEIIARNPFKREATEDPSHLLVLFLKKAVSAANARALRAVVTGPESARVRGKHVYIVYPEGIGRSKLTTTRVETALGTRATGRNWNTVVKLTTLCP